MNYKPNYIVSQHNNLPQPTPYLPKFILKVSNLTFGFVRQHYTFKFATVRHQSLALYYPNYTKVRPYYKPKIITIHKHCTKASVKIISEHVY